MDRQRRLGGFDKLVSPETARVLLGHGILITRKQRISIAEQVPRASKKTINPRQVPKHLDQDGEVRLAEDREVLYYLAMFFESPDLVQMRDGSAYVGTVANKSINVDTADGSAIRVKKSTIAWIIFRNDYGYGMDHIQLHNGTEVRGKVKEDVIFFESEELGKVSIPTKRVLAIQLPPT
jgi:hypothetical protein